MSYFPRAARLVVVLAVAFAGSVVASAAVAVDHPRSAKVSRDHGDKLTTKQVRQRARAQERAEAARVRVARLHARAVARKNLRLRNNKRIPHRSAIIFNKNWDDPYDSRIIFRSWAKTGPKGKKKWVRVEQASWRAGSGLSGAAGRDACHRGKGWAPNGTYSFVQHNRRKAPLINGRVFELQPMACRNGTVRQMMFIHSEQTWKNTQCKN